MRTEVTVIASALIVLTIAVLAVLTSLFLKREAAIDLSSASGGAVCLLAGGRQVVVHEEENRLLLAEDGCLAPYRLVDEARGDPEAFCASILDFEAAPPELSLWPLTDPDTIGYPPVPDDHLRCADGISLVPTEHGGQQVALAQRTLNNQVLGLVGAALLLSACGSAVVWITTGRVLRPVEAIRREVADITEHDLARRVPVPRSCNEIARLATTVNETLDRLQGAVEDNRRFVADASHELRGPIAALRAELEIAHEHPDLTDWRAVVDGALEDTYRLQHLATDLLLLARLDHGSTSTAAGVDLAAVVREEAARRRSSGKALTTDVGDEPVRVRGNRAMLTRLLANLLDNAERHATSGTAVRLEVVDGTAVLDVVDDGPGVAPEDRERIFDRFTRLDDARTRAGGGTGLGLAIARRVATAHRGTLRVSDHDGGGRFTARIPVT
jgi:signal transduction histidine kinase